MAKKITAILLLTVAVLMLAYCRGDKSETENLGTLDTETLTLAVTEIMQNHNGKFEGKAKALVCSDFLLWMGENYGEESILRLREQLNGGSFSDDSWFELTRNTLRVLECYYKGESDPTSPNYRDDITVIGNGDSDVVIRVTGDVSFADNWHIAPKIAERGMGIDGVMGENALALLRNADITLVNNEFTYSTRGNPLANKLYTFRAHPDRVQYMKDMGVDIVSLANNHAFDFGKDAFLDTLDTLKNAEVKYIGGGKDISEASRPQYFIVGGRMIGISAATKAEKYILTPEATETEPGVLRTYDPTRYIEVIEAVEAECDYNIAYVHWGKEDHHEIEEGLPEMGRQFIDAGADIVIGVHAHVLQGIEFYDGVPICYNLGNFLFNAKTLDAGILELSADNGGEFKYRFIPCVQTDYRTETAVEVEAERILEFMEKLSIDVEFDENGYFTPKQ